MSQTPSTGGVQLAFEEVNDCTSGHHTRTSPGQRDHESRGSTRNSFEYKHRKQEPHEWGTRQLAIHVPQGGWGAARHVHALGVGAVNNIIIIIASWA